MKDENANIEIRKVSNGVIVMPAYDNRSACPASLDQTMVFDSKEAFVKWAGEFFPNIKDKK